MFTIGEYTGLRQFRKSCDRKTPYKSAGAADAAIRSLRRRKEREGKSDGADLESYPCRHCPNFHVGHKRQQGEANGKTEAAGAQGTRAQAGGNEEEGTARCR